MNKAKKKIAAFLASAAMMANLAAVHACAAGDVASVITNTWNAVRGQVQGQGADARGGEGGGEPGGGVQPGQALPHQGQGGQALPAAGVVCRRAQGLRQLALIPQGQAQGVRVQGQALQGQIGSQRGPGQVRALFNARQPPQGQPPAARDPRDPGRVVPKGPVDPGARMGGIVRRADRENALF